MNTTTLTTLFIGQSILKLKDVESTNDYLYNLLTNVKPLVDGTVILAENQFGGKGQHGSAWITEPGKNLTFSLFLNTLFLKANQQFYLNMAISLGVVDFISHYIKKGVSIKWPNDLYVNDKKIGGILIENILSGNYLKNSIIGIGINVNQLEFDNSTKNPTSLAIETGLQFNLDQLLNELLSNIEANYLFLKSLKFENLKIQYLEHLLGYNIERKFLKAGVEIKGTITDVTQEGFLEINNTDGVAEKYDIKQIAFII